jgi:hypothetical protein
MIYVVDTVHVSNRNTLDDQIMFLKCELINPPILTLGNTANIREILFYYSMPLKIFVLKRQTFRILHNKNLHNLNRLDGTAPKIN